MEISEFLEDLKELGIGGSDTTATASVTPPPSLVPDSGIDMQWVPLELCFGVPLFEPQANESVCNKVRS